MADDLPVLGTALATFAVLVAGCIGSPAPEDVQAESIAVPELPGARPEVKVPVIDPLILLESLGGTEPTLRANAQDHIFVVTTGTNLWRSLDGGKTFEALGEEVCTAPVVGPVDTPVCPPGRRDKDSGIRGGGDASLALDSHGRLYWLGLAGGMAGSVPFQFSDDEGMTWSDPVDLAEGRSADREWIAIGPSDEVYAIWRDDRGLVFSSSVDRGEGWGEVVTIDPANPIGGPVVVDQGSGAIYVPLSGFDGGPVQVARSLDAGATWEIVDVPSRFESNPVAMTLGTGIRHFIFAVAAVDAAGTAYVVWSEDADAPPEMPTLGGKTAMIPEVFLSVSRDQGATWGEAIQLSPQGVPAVLPWIVAGDAGRIAVGWYEGVMEAPGEIAPNEWHITLAMSTTADGAEPVFAAAHATQQPIHLGSICTQGTGCSAGDRSRGDFFEIAIRPNGLPILSFVQDTLPPNEETRRTDVVVSRVVDGTPLIDVPVLEA